MSAPGRREDTTHPLNKTNSHTLVHALALTPNLHAHALALAPNPHTKAIALTLVFALNTPGG